MEEKNVQFIRSLASHSGELAGSAMRRNAAAKPAEQSPSCQICGGSGWKDMVSGAERRVTRCDCFLQTQSKHFLAASEIPVRYTNCDFSNYETGGNDGLATAKLKVEAWAAHYPVDRTGL